ncbi:MAG: hypothetical protein NUV60_00805 [Patescibacteria group bacterium]|nr:hypothetical protein [Patescibacteria group bacterium]
MKNTLFLSVLFVAGIISVLSFPAPTFAASTTWVAYQPTRDCGPQIVQVAACQIDGSCMVDGDGYIWSGDTTETWVVATRVEGFDTWYMEYIPYAIPSGWAIDVVDYDYDTGAPLYAACSPYYDSSTVSATFTASDGKPNSYSYSPGETVTIVAGAVIGDHPEIGTGNTVNNVIQVVTNAIENVLDALTCFLFGCSGPSVPWAAVYIDFPGQTRHSCSGEGGCTTTESFPAPTASGTYTVSLIGQPPDAGVTSSFTITVAASPPPSAPAVVGTCSTDHYACTGGISTNNSDSNSSKWTWNCVGTSNTASCQETKPPGATATVVINVSPGLDFYIEPKPPGATSVSISSGSSKNLSYSSTNATTCSATGPFGSSVDVPTSYTNWSTGALTTTATYSITCNGANGTTPVTKSVTINVPSINLYFSSP